MTLVDVSALLPLLVPAVAVVLLMVSMSVRRNPDVALGLSTAGLIGGLIGLSASAAVGDHEVLWLVTVDGWTRAWWAVVLLAGLAVAPMAHAWVVARGEPVDEVHLLVLLATLGAALLAAATHTASLVLGLELLSVSLYALVAYPRSRHLAAEAGAKYLMLAAGASAFALFGLALIYAGTGTLSLMGPPGGPAVGGSAPLVSAGAALLLVGVGFKLAVVPFHSWAPDVYQGAPAPMTALVATVSKAGVLALLARITLQSPLGLSPAFLSTLAWMAGASMLVGNLLALRQRNLKRLLAYSSIAHLGYVLVAVVAGDGPAVVLYLAAYVVTSLGAFGAIALLTVEGREVEDIEDYRGMFWRHPVLALILTTTLLSLAGIPLTAGFIGKLWVLLAGVGGAWWPLVAALVVGSTLGLYYYLRVVAVMFADPGDAPELTSSRSLAAWIPVVLAWAGVLGLGVFPTAVLWFVP